MYLKQTITVLVFVLSLLLLLLLVVMLMIKDYRPSYSHCMMAFFTSRWFKMSVFVFAYNSL